MRTDHHWVSFGWLLVGVLQSMLFCCVVLELKIWCQNFKVQRNSALRCARRVRPGHDEKGRGNKDTKRTLELPGPIPRSQSDPVPRRPSEQWWWSFWAASLDKTKHFSPSTTCSTWRNNADSEISLKFVSSFLGFEPSHLSLLFHFHQWTQQKHVWAILLQVLNAWLILNAPVIDYLSLP